MMSFPKKLPTNRNILIESRGNEENGFEEKTYKAKQKIDEQQKEIYSKLQIDKQLNNNHEERMSCCNYNEIDGDSLLNENLKSQTNQKNESTSDVQKNDHSFFRTIKRLLKNRILLCRIASTIFHTLPVSGLYTFLPKYLEYQFRITASDASFVSGRSF